MAYGQEKRREMVRSLLPSKNREAARAERARIHRAARHHTHEQMAQLARAPEVFEELAGWEDDVTRQVRQRVMSWRRDGDKLKPFLRWARAHTRTLPLLHRLDSLRPLVPPGLIGQHALGHLEHEPDFEHPNDAAIREARWRAWRHPRPPECLDAGEQAELLRAILIAPGGHRSFNQWIKAKDRSLGTRESRPLLGPWDVKPFLAEYRARAYNTLPRNMGAVNAFLCRFKRHRDAEATLEALLRTLPPPYKPYGALGSP